MDPRKNVGVTPRSKDQPRVTAVSRDPLHRFSKPVVAEINLVKDWGVEGDAHAGRTGQHRSRVARDPSQPNLRQVHLIPEELFDELASAGYTVVAGELGENITTRGIDLLNLPIETQLRFGNEAIVQVTGLRNPCQQINTFEPGLLREVLGRAEDGSVERKSGVMAVVIASGFVRPHDLISVTLPTGVWKPLIPV
jgi:MOSC domain-containing protein YiiM